MAKIETAFVVNIDNETKQVSNRKESNKAFNAEHSNPNAIFRTLREMDETALSGYIAENTKDMKINLTILSIIKGNKLGLFREFMRPAKKTPSTPVACVREISHTLRYAFKKANETGIKSVDETQFREYVGMRIAEIAEKNATN